MYLNCELMFMSELFNACVLFNDLFTVLYWVFFLFFPTSRSAMKILS